MIHTINITTTTREGDAYPVVSINEYPIIYIDEEDVQHIFDDPELINLIKNRIKNNTTYQNAIIKVRTLNDDFDATDSSFKLSEVIDIPEWK